MPGWVDEYTIYAKQGDSITFTAAYQEDDGTPIDLTGCSVEFSVAKARRKTPAWSWTTAPHVTISDAANGEVSVELAPDDSREWGKLEELQYELTVTFPDGERVTILEGPISVRLEVAEHE